MRYLAMVGDAELPALSQRTPAPPVTFDTVPLTGTFLERPSPPFVSTAPGSRSRVLVRVEAFSRNHGSRAALTESASGPAATMGSGADFCGSVVAAGADAGFAPGTRVMGSGEACPRSTPVAEGQSRLPVAASEELQVLPAAELVPVPYEMPVEVAAGFSSCARAAYSMVRRLEVQPGESVLVVAARSNVSLIAIQALRRLSAEVIAVTGSRLHHSQLRALGANEVVFSPPNPGGRPLAARLEELSTSIGGFSSVVDPFFDLHLNQSVFLLAKQGRYVTCGISDPFGKAVGRQIAAHNVELAHGIVMALERNQRLIFDSGGTRADLERAIADYQAGALRLPVDSVFSKPEDAGLFLHRTYADPDRFGKVVFRYC